MCPSCEDERAVIEYLFNKTILYMLSIKERDFANHVLMKKGEIIDILIDYLDVDDLDYPDDICKTIGLEYNKIVEYNRDISISIYADCGDDANIALTFHVCLLRVLKENNTTYIESKFSDNEQIIIERIGYLYNEDYDDYFGVTYDEDLHYNESFCCKCSNSIRHFYDDHTYSFNYDPRIHEDSLMESGYGKCVGCSRPLCNRCCCDCGYTYDEEI